MAIITAYLEFFVMAPLCFLLYRSLVQKRPSRHIFQAIVATLQAIGTYYFTLDEIWNGFKNVPVDRDFDFTFEHIFYFWIFFVGANILWFFGSIALVISAWKNQMLELNIKKIK
mgnify:CR=1 FL=1